MSQPEVILHRVGSVSTDVVRRLGEKLRESGFEIVAAVPASSHLAVIISFHGPLEAEAVIEIVAQECRAGVQPVLVVADERSALDNGLVWKLLAAGAQDVFSVGEFPEAISSVVSRVRQIHSIETLLGQPVVRDQLVGPSRVWQRTLRQVVDCALTRSSLLILGETGTGKELVARLIHELDPRENKGRFVVLDCTTIAPELAGSEFFGHERGAFTHAVTARDGAFFLAHGGTLFLDEIGELPPVLQAELLRVVQEKTFKRIGGNTWQQTEFRLVSATHRDIARDAEQGRFRCDFYHRVAAWTCRLPPLRDRREDIIPLAQHFLRQESGQDLELSDPVREFLLARDYPGNVRELRQLVTRMALRHRQTPGPLTVGAIPEDDRWSARALEQDWTEGGFETALCRALASGCGLQDIKERTTDLVIRLALRDTDGNLQRAALRLGVTDRALQLRRAADRQSIRTISP
jgi:transcriptional regulator with GAF, ATPase, and Fis domain